MFHNRPSARAATLRARKPLVGLVAAVAVASLVGSASTPGLVTVADSELPVSPGDRVLQSVEIAMGPDGTLTAVEGTTVTASADGESADSTTQAYSPDDVVSDLPVRVLTSYRTADGTGSDLADLEGYDGEVQIDLTVQNLTVEAQDITYDVPGGSRTRPALVGAPLTIVAGADLGSTDPARVVTQSAGQDNVTNGVLSQGADGATQVQWATILAPPQLSSSATLSLVVDAKDFSAPAFDLSVQPGLVTDPSVGALVENAFNPAASEELALQARTVEVVGEVNEVLAEAGDSISAVRDSLNSTTETLGQKTVGDLETSITGIAASMEALDGTVTGLGDGISSALDSTGSSSLAQLESTVNSVDSLLGDTSGAVPAAPASGGGCGASVRTGAGAGSVYDSLRRVAGTLKGYAAASEACKEQLGQQILVSIGPDVPSPAICVPPSPNSANPFTESVTCSLFRAKDDFRGVADKIRETTESVQNTVDTTGISDALDATLGLENQVDRTISALTEIRGSLPEDEVLELGDLIKARNAFAAQGQAFTTAITAVRSTADTNLSQNRDLAAALCGLIAPDEAAVQPGQLTRATVESLRSKLTLVPCAEVTEENPATFPGWQSVIDATDTSDGSQSDFGKAMNLYKSNLRALNDAILVLETANEASGQTDPAKKTLKDKLDDLLKSEGGLTSTRDEVKAAATALRTSEQKAKDQIEAGIEAAAVSAEGLGASAIDPAIRQVGRKADEVRDSVGEVFENSQAGMNAAADDIVKDGKATINEQKAGLDKTSKEATSAIESNVRQGLDVIADTVSASTRDTDAAGKLLTADLTKVLLDLGDPEVEGAGLLGTLGANAGDARAADFQLALATRTASSYANARGQDIGGLMLRQAQAEAAFKRQAQLQAFQVDVPEGVERRTVYSFHLAAGQ
ncbi:hypothetical protein ENKNEFLB_00469 [Nocardioides aquaticus]|uniref:Uncharacterized protein n=1 Tax=Nocardioides aquaticus TaxID=160826 RepID=A0ABX8EDG2_9ACTN|nr:hypothetical protein ENKNEFLB_00469 [Nocardioides aquaticus]